MVLTFKGSFLRDWKNCNNKRLTKAVAEKIREIENANSFRSVSHLKKLRVRKSGYKIEIKLSAIKIYWILCEIKGEKMRFVRLKPEAYFKKHL